jgi:Sel1 repeat
VVRSHLEIGPHDSAFETFKMFRADFSPGLCIRHGMRKLVPLKSESTIEVPVNSFWKQPVLLMLFGFALIPVLAQPPAPQATAVDPALLAKATAGDAASQLQVADACAAGKGVPRDSRQLAADYAQAALWYRKAADQGNTMAQVHLADLYRDGRGVTRDPAQAAAWYRKAAELGDPGAQGTLGILYSVGMGVTQDYVEAYYWLCLAASVKGPTQARFMTNRQSVGEHITTDQQAAVEDRVAAWQAAHPRPNAAQ